MKVKIFELGTIVKDTASGIKGMLTHFCLDIAGNREYIFQPYGLNPSTQRPVDVIMITEPRIKQGTTIDIDIPTEVLDTEVEDIASGYKGKAIGLTLHLSGCTHIDIKAKGILEETGATIDTVNVDIRRLTGPAIPKMTKAELKEDVKDKPSPMHVPKVKRR